MTSDYIRWAEGYGRIVHTEETCRRVQGVSERFDREMVLRVLAAADRLASAGMWTVAHMTYARRVDLSGAPLPIEAFKAKPQGHTGGALNVVPAYVGYLAANLITAQTRGWLLGQGHCAAAIEAVNALTGNLSPAQEGRYGPDEAGLSRLCADFYSYELDAAGRPLRPLGSHLTPHTGGALAEGGYLGFAEIQYVHMPLPGESLVAFLSDGAFEEQRGGDWSDRWWRAEDCGLVVPIMILNGRRIEQRTEIAQDGGAGWLTQHLRANGFDPFVIDGRDPAAFAWAILECEQRLASAAAAVQSGAAVYPVRLPYVIATTVKGYGFPGAGTLAAHNLPLPASPRVDAKSLRLFHEGAAALYVAPQELNAARAVFALRDQQERPAERDNPLATRWTATPVFPEEQGPPTELVSPMAAIDAWFVALAEANSHLRLRIGNPDELSSNRMSAALARFKHRVNRPEPGAPEAVDGAVITALNEEAVASAALANKGGLNLIVTYEAFAPKMLGALRQEIIFARQRKEAGYAPGWLGVPLLATSHTWENGKNQQSHQDPTIGEAMLGEMADVARVLFPVDGATAVAALRSLYAQRGVVGCVVAPKGEVAARLSPSAADEALREGVVEIGHDAAPAVQFLAVGAYQLAQAEAASSRLRAAGVPVRLTALLEPARLRTPRDKWEASVTLPDERLDAMFPRSARRVLVAHTRPEPLLGLLRRIDGGPGRLRAHGFQNRGGTLDLFGMLFANRCTFAHLVRSAAALVGVDEARLLTAAERSALDGAGDPQALRAGAGLALGQVDDRAAGPG
jgi:phosphoketolase